MAFEWLVRWLGKSKVTEKQLQLLALAGPLAKTNAEPFDRLASRYDRETCQQCLRQWWSVEHRPALLQTMHWLLEEGHGAECRSILDGELAERALSVEDPAGRVGFARSHRAVLERDGLVGWDAGRLVSVARWGLVAGYLDAGEAWVWIERAGARVYERYSEWNEYGTSWELGLRFWSDGHPMPADAQKSLDWLRNAEESPWRQLTFPGSARGGRRLSDNAL